jgi:hypothetical protein
MPNGTLNVQIGMRMIRKACRMAGGDWPSTLRIVKLAADL